jgi:AAA family ATP:ADP antiporter
MTTFADRLLRPIARRLNLDPQERAVLALMCCLIAVLMCAYTIAKVLRDALFLSEYGAVALPFAYVVVAFASAGFVWLEGRVARRSSRARASTVAQLLAILFSAAAAILFPIERHGIAAAFYVWTGSQALMLIPHFWVLALDVWDTRRARSIFPLLTGFGLLGGMAGGAFAGWATPLIGRDTLIWLMCGLFVLTHVLTITVSRRSPRRAGLLSTPVTVSRWRLLRRSRYLKFLALGLALSVAVSTLVDFQFKYFIQALYPDPHRLTQFLGKFYLGLNTLALVFQFGLAGLLLHRLGLGAATGLQPTSVLLFASWMSVTPGWWAAVAMRWVQGVVFQTLGKSSTEMYYLAIRPPERRVIKPTIDTLVERWADAAVGVVLIVVLAGIGVSVKMVAALTACLAAVWAIVQWRLNRQYVRAFHTALSSRWLELDDAAESLELPAARRALIDALSAREEHRVLLALRLVSGAHHAEIRRAVRACVQHSSPAVRAAAVRAMEAMRLRDREGVIERFLNETDEQLRRAAVSYLLALSTQPTVFVRTLINGDDPALRQYVLDALNERPSDAPGAVTLEWIDQRIASGAREDLQLAARALGAITGTASAQRLRALMTSPDPDVQLAAVSSAVRRPSRELMETLLTLLEVPHLSYEVQRALAALGDAAVPPLRRLLDDSDRQRPRRLAAYTLALIGTSRATVPLRQLVRSADPADRYLGLKNLNRTRILRGSPVLPRDFVHRLFLRELRDYRSCAEPAEALQDSPQPELRLLGESFRESADRALDRALRALGCWYDPQPLAGVYVRLQSTPIAGAAPALEYLGHVLPRHVFRPVRQLFELRTSTSETQDGPSAAPVEQIVQAWRYGDTWLRACAVRAARVTPQVDLALFRDGDAQDPLVRTELDAFWAARADGGDGGARAEERYATGGGGC